MPGVTKEQIRAAKQIRAIDFLLQYRPDDIVPSQCRGEFQLRSHDSFKISGETSLWHWKSRDVGGKSALDYLIHVEGMRFTEAVLLLLDQAPAVTCHDPAPMQLPKPKPFALPEAAADNRRVFAYLLHRGIDRRVISDCIRAGILYESARFHNAVFVGRDEDGVPRYAFLRGTLTNAAESFRAEVAGSDKRYSFCLPPEGESQRVAVYEAAIEVLAHLSLEQTRDKYRLSLGGIYAPKEGVSAGSFKKPAALTAFLEQHPNVCEIEICTNNDHAGRWAAEHIRREYEGKYRIVLNLPDREGADYGDLAQEKSKERAVRQRAALSR
ncbi:MAG TPA: DUF3991 domain-containing protein [Candidatus Fournierella merdipullorum]|uniref:DUF3991 domain-containing protein n=1 Tax=Candidatus Allofournierella merdipullorum TaxID=2838595 RepID=A0A9D2E342_9FIRM|nr:DUF3991 domain-containing protein [Candidatus Fournierella merdipullorum]